MSHPEPDDLALGVLEGFPDPVRRHIDECPTCAEEVAALLRVVDAGRAGGPAPQTSERPSDAVWERIAEELQLPAAALPPAATSPEAAAPPAAVAQEPRSGATVAPTPIRAARATRWWSRPTAWVAAAALALGALGTVLIQRVVDPPDATVLASAELQALPGWDAEGRAEVAEVGGEHVLLVDLEAAPESGYREVWLISLDLERLVSVGVLTGSDGRFVLPDGLDLEDFAIVDVSAEPLDGDPAHSGDSIVRGELS